MNSDDSPMPNRPPALWAVLLAFAVVYVCWGTTYIAIREGVKYFPPALFGGVRLTLAGIVLLTFLGLRGHSLVITWRHAGLMLVVGAFLFVGGNGLITLAEKTVESGEASVLIATTPLFLALLELAWPWGDRLTWIGWLGLIAGLGGVFVLLSSDPASLIREVGPLLALGSALSWALGSFILRHAGRRTTPLTDAAWQLLLGGGALTVIGLITGEAGQITAASFAPTGVLAFFHLLVFGSLAGFVAYVWLLNHVSAVMAGSYAYVNPVVAVLTGWLLAGEHITLPILGGMAVILLSVGLVRLGAVHPRPANAEATVPSKPREPRPRPLFSSSGSR